MGMMNRSEAKDVLKKLDNRVLTPRREMVKNKIRIYINLSDQGKMTNNEFKEKTLNIIDNITLL